MASGIKEEPSDGEELGMKGEILPKYGLKFGDTLKMEMLALRETEQRRAAVDAPQNHKHEHEMDTDSAKSDLESQSGDDSDEDDRFEPEESGDDSDYEEKPMAKRPGPSHEGQPLGKRLKAHSTSDHIPKKPALGFGQSANLEESDDEEENIDDAGVRLQGLKNLIKRLAKKAIECKPSLEDDIERQKTAFLSVISELRGKGQYEKGWKWNVKGLKEKPSNVQLFCKRAELLGLLLMLKTPV
jgi:hypothetical protein